MDVLLKSSIENLLNETIKDIHKITGGDISQVFKIITAKNQYAIKTNTQSLAQDLFETESQALKAIHQTHTIKVPQVIAHGKHGNTAFILMEFIESKPPIKHDFERLGIKLANLHQCTNHTHGWEQHNFIGSLPQSNTPNSSWLEFYVIERLSPQLQLAKQRGLLSNDECPTEKTMKALLEPLLHDVKPSLLHGDLWSGNYLISKNGEPYLIDPAIYYGHHEVDLAMTKLFGGFSEPFYKAYHNIIPEIREAPKRTGLYQLYYLLVHLNLFGSSYYPQVKALLSKYF